MQSGETVGCKKLSRLSSLPLCEESEKDACGYG